MSSHDQLRRDLTQARSAPLHKEADGRYSGPPETGYAINRLLDRIEPMRADAERLRAALTYTEANLRALADSLNYYTHQGIRERLTAEIDRLARVGEQT